MESTEKKSTCHWLMRNKTKTTKINEIKYFKVLHFAQERSKSVKVFIT